jgi:hypothetical protein
LDEITEFCGRIKEYNISWWGQTRVNTVTGDILNMMKSAGCVLLTLGVESADDTILKSMKKGTTVAQIEKAFSAAEEVGLHATGNIIFGDLAETPSTVRNTLTWKARHKNWDIVLRYIWTFPGSYIYERACEMGKITDRVEYLKTGCAQLNLTSMTDEQWTQMITEIELFNWKLEAPNSERFDGKIDKEKIATAIAQIARDYKVGIWPATIDNVKTLRNIAPSILDSLFLINRNLNSQHLQGINELRLVVNTPNVILEENIEFILVPYNNSTYNWICKTTKQFYPNVKQVLHIGQLL